MNDRIDEEVMQRAKELYDRSAAREKRRWGKALTATRQQFLQQAELQIEEERRQRYVAELQERAQWRRERRELLQRRIAEVQASEQELPPAEAPRKPWWKFW